MFWLDIIVFILYRKTNTAFLNRFLNKNKLSYLQKNNILGVIRHLKILLMSFDRLKDFTFSSVLCIPCCLGIQPCQPAIEALQDEHYVFLLTHIPLYPASCLDSASYLLIGFVGII